MQELKEYTIRVTAENSLYKDYDVKAENLFYAKIKARTLFLEDFPEATNITLSLAEPTEENVTEILNIIKEAK